MFRALSRGAGFVRRSRLEIIYTILSLCRNAGAKKTRIMYRSNLSFNQLEKYLETLTSLGLLATDKGVYRLTEKGNEFLREFQDLKRLLE